MINRWLRPALDYIPRWLEYQMRLTEQPGCVVAIAHRNHLLLERAFGFANLGRQIPLTPRHRFRVASHSKSFTAAGFMKLRERGEIRLDDPVGQHLTGLHREIARATIGQLLSHSAGLVRDGEDCGQWADRRSFRDRDELLGDLAGGPTIPANTRFKYSNHGYGLAGLVLEQITGEPYASWIHREVIEAAGLAETWPDAPVPRKIPMASGHTTKMVPGHRLIIPGDNPTNALAPATGFVSTAADLVRFYGQLSPLARRSFLSTASRREMVRRQWTAPHTSVERHYGLGIISGGTGDWDWFGHSGGFQGYITRTAVLPAQELAISVLTNAADGPAQAWLEGAIQICRAFARHGKPVSKVASWAGRWWGLWGAVDLVPMGKRILVASPAAPNPILDASEVEITGRDRGRIVLDGGFGSHGEMIWRERSAGGAVTGLWLAGMKLLSEPRLARELGRRYRAR
jgi:CubicO group peptidase (beta-lactamase class C family)